MGKFGPFVIDADGHGGEPADWQERLPREEHPGIEPMRARVVWTLLLQALGARFRSRDGSFDPVFQLCQRIDEEIHRGA